MASSKVMASSKPKSSDLTQSTARSRRANNSGSDQLKTLNYNFNSTAPTSLVTPLESSSTMTVDGILRNTTSSDSTLLDAQITLIDNPTPPPPQPQQTVANHNSTANNNNNNNGTTANTTTTSNKTVDDVWREIVSGRKEMKEEAPDEMMTLEDFLAKAGAVVEDDDVDDVKMPLPLTNSGGCGIYALDSNSSRQGSGFQMLDKIEGSIVGFGNGSDGSLGRGKRGRSVVMEPLDKAAQQRQRRMIKNRESAARSRERKQAYQVELESLAVRLEEENEQLLKEKEERTKERYKQISELFSFLDGPWRSAYPVSS